MTGDLHREFEVGEQVRIEATTAAGDVVISPGAAGQVAVRVTGGEGVYTAEQSGEVLIIRPLRKGFLGRYGRCDVHLEVPADARLAVNCTSGDVMVNGTVGELEVAGVSGDVRIIAVTGSCTVRSASGDVAISEVGGRLAVTTASGKVRVGTVAGDVSATTASGEIQVDRLGADAELRTATGDIDVGCFDGADIVVKTLSGDVTLGLPPRRILDVDIETLSGRLRNELVAGVDAEAEPVRAAALRCSSVSGDVTLRGT